MAIVYIEIQSLPEIQYSIIQNQYLLFGFIHRWGKVIMNSKIYQFFFNFASILNENCQLCFVIILINPKGIHQQPN